MSKALTASSKIALLIVLVGIITALATIYSDKFLSGNFAGIAVALVGGIFLIVLSIAFVISLITEYKTPHAVDGLNVPIQLVIGIPLSLFFVYTLFATFASSN